MTLENKDTNKLSAAILKRIEGEGMAPRPRWRFVAREWIVWGLLLLAVLLGALAVAALIFASLNAGWEYYEATHENFTTFAAEVLPYVWLVVLGAGVLLAYFNMRETKRGYRYSLWLVVLGSVGASVFGGVLLHSMGMSHMIEEKLGAQLPYTKSVASVQRELWQDPERGRLLGVYVDEADYEDGEYDDGDEYEYDDDDERPYFLDQDAYEWPVTIDSLLPHDLELLQSGEEVRVVGMPSADEMHFEICGVLPGIAPGEVPMAEMREYRTHFSERVAEVREAARATRTAVETTRPISEICYKVFARMRSAAVREAMPMPPRERVEGVRFAPVRDGVQ